MTESAGRYDKQARRDERARVVRLSRLPFLYDFALRGRRQAVLTVVAQGVLAVLIGLVPVKLVSGSWLPPGAALLVLAAAVGLQLLSRYLNARAGRR